MVVLVEVLACTVANPVEVLACRLAALEVVQVHKQAKLEEASQVLLPPFRLSFRQRSLSPYDV